MEVRLIKGNSHSDERGKVSFNNNFDASKVKRIYTIQNRDSSFQRGWQGHSIEQRWFSAIEGSFRVKVIKIDNWENPSRDVPVETYIISDSSLEVLQVPGGHITCLQSMTENAKLLVMADYLFGEVKDEYRYPLNYFNS